MEPEPKIEIFEPSGAAYELTRRILFQPFDLSKWLVIGFAAFLAQLGEGGGLNFPSGGDSNFNLRNRSDEALEAANAMPPWVIPLIVAIVLFVIALIIVCAWLSARGKFIFTDCIVHNRGAIVAPWKEYKREGNSYFLFSLLAGLLVLLVMAAASAPLWLPLVLGSEFPTGTLLFVELTGAVLISFAVAAPTAVILSFMVPIMYRRRCRSREGFTAAVAAIAASPGPVILYALFRAVLFIAFVFGSCVLTCVTCCLTALPYIGTVILLPVHVLLMSHMLLFVRQFGADYDAWGTLPPEPTLPPVDQPPIQEPPTDQPPSEPPPLPA